MSRQQRETIDQMLRDAPFDLGGDVLVQRPLLEQMLTSHPLAHDVRTTSSELGGVPVVLIEIADTEPNGLIFHIHGGGFALGSAASSVGFASELARKAGMSAITVDYRLAPEHPYPAALHDVTAGYQALLERESSGAQIVVSGESAGADDATRLATRAAANDVAVILDITPAVAHVFQALSAVLDEGDQALTRAGTFLQAHVQTPATTLGPPRPQPRPVSLPEISPGTRTSLPRRDPGRGRRLPFAA